LSLKKSRMHSYAIRPLGLVGLQYVNLTLLTLLMLPIWGCTQPAKSSAPAVVFVCEHGAAKSVIAAAYFNKLAAERHLNFHAVARGLTPQPELSSSAVAGLEKDGVPFTNEQPRRLSLEEARTAVRVVAFCPIPKGLAEGRLQSFDVPAPNEGYSTSRDAILVPVKALVDELASRNGN